MVQISQVAANRLKGRVWQVVSPTYGWEDRTSHRYISVDTSRITDTFSLRDYVAYLFPGLVLLGSLAIIKPDLWDMIVSEFVTASVVLLVGGYILGFVSKTVSELMVKYLLDPILGNPMEELIKPKPGRFNNPPEDLLRQALVERLCVAWGKEFVEKNLEQDKEIELMSLCWRDIQKHDHLGLDYLFRCVTLFNIATNMIFPCIAIFVVFVFYEHYLFAVVSLLVLVSMCQIRYSYMKEFATNIYRIWFVINKDASK